VNCFIAVSTVVTVCTRMMLYVCTYVCMYVCGLLLLTVSSRHAADETDHVSYF